MSCHLVCFLLETDDGLVIATSLDWPRDAWMLLLQSVLVGKAREVYSGMSIEQSTQYNHVKLLFLKLTNWCLKSTDKTSGTIRKERNKHILNLPERRRHCSTGGALLEKWQENSKNLQLVLVEEFKACVPVNIKTYIDEQKATTLQQAAVLADDYSLMHRGAFHSPDVGAGSFVGGKDKSSTSLNPPQPNSGNHRNQTDQRAPGRSRSVVCNYCHRRGHVMAECWSLQKKKTDALVHTVEQPDLVSSQVAKERQ